LNVEAIAAKAAADRNQRVTEKEKAKHRVKQQVLMTWPPIKTNDPSSTLE